MKQRILIIDDEPPMLKQLARILRERTAYEISTESNPLEVPKILDKEQFDLIITDMGMPGLDGMQILRLVRERERFEEVVIITAFGSLDSVLEAVTEGVFDYVVKPFRKTQIIGIVKRAMQAQKLRREDLRLRAACTQEPYAAAESTFRQEYLRRLAGQVGADIQVLAQRTGLSAREISIALEIESTGTGKNEE
jgi:DNA-binding NtrC family response regulator